jgi:membrane-associated phospholipid phosphatase
MKKILSTLLLVIGVSGSSFTQESTLSTRDTMLSVNEPVLTGSVAGTVRKREQVYKFKPAIDIPLIVVTSGTTLLGFSKIYNKERLTVEEVESLDPRNVNRFDRSATRHYNDSKVPDYLFYSSMPLPLLLLLDNKMRKDFPKLAALYLEAMGVTGIIYVTAVHFGDRYRPYTYNDEAPMDFKLRGGSRNSFFAGHPSLVGTSTFFMATVYADYHPESKVKWLFYALASAATAGTAIGRYLGGRHFPSDIIIGITLGPLSGMLIPHLHKNKDLSKRKTVVMPFFGESSGLALVHKF